MKIKVCYNNETHRISKLPESYEALTKLISTIFLSAIPESWRLEYVDSDGDKIMLADEQDYKEFLESELKNIEGTSSVKVYIVPYSLPSRSQIISVAESQDISRQNNDDDYNIIRKESGEESEINIQKEEEVQPQEELPAGSEVEEKNVLNEDLQIKEVDLGEFKEEAVAEQPESHERVELEHMEEVPVEKLESNERVETEQKEVEQPKEENQEPKTEPEEEKKVEQVQKPVIIAPKLLPMKKPLKGKLAPKCEKPKEQKIVKKPIKKVCKQQTLDKLIENAVEKNIAKIAMMTSSFLSNKTSNTQTQTQTQVTLQAQTQTQAQVQVQEKPQEQIPVVHRGVRCDGCQLAPIVGIRYKCSVCPDFDFCERCEKEREHSHAFIKIKFPGHAFAHRCHGPQHFPHPPHFHPFQPSLNPHPFHPPFLNPRPCKMIFGDKPDASVEPTKLSTENLEALKKPVLLENLDSISMTTSQLIIPDEKESKVEEEKPLIEEAKVEEPREEKREEVVEAEVKEEVQEKKEIHEYSNAVQNKAVQLKELLPAVDLEILLSFVDNAPEDLDLAELLENLKY